MGTVGVVVGATGVVGDVPVVGMIGPVPVLPPPPGPVPPVWSSGIFSITAMASCQAVSTWSACCCALVSRASAQPL